MCHDAGEWHGAGLNSQASKMVSLSRRMKADDLKLAVKSFDCNIVPPLRILVCVGRRCSRRKGFRANDGKTGIDVRPSVSSNPRTLRCSATTSITVCDTTSVALPYYSALPPLGLETCSATLPVQHAPPFCAMAASPSHISCPQRKVTVILNRFLLALFCDTPDTPRDHV